MSQVDQKTSSPVFCRLHLGGFVSSHCTIVYGSWSVDSALQLSN